MISMAGRQSFFEYMKVVSVLSPLGGRHVRWWPVLALVGANHARRGQLERQPEWVETGRLILVLHLGSRVLGGGFT